MPVKSKKGTAARATPVKSLRPNDVKVIVQEVLDEMGIIKSKADLQAIAAEAAKKAVEETLLAMGVDVRNPIATQQMFTGLRDIVDTFTDKKFQADMQRLRTWRVTMDNIKAKSILTIVGLGVAALSVAIWPRLRGVEAP